MAEPLPLAFYRRDPVVVAQELLNKVLVRGQRQGRIVETEAYGGSSDPASHAFRGLTPRNATMFGPAGHLYVYFTYGMHFCFNIVTERNEVPGAVLIRGLDEIDAANGPARLCRALGLDRRHNGLDLTADGDLWIERGRPRAGERIVQTRRVGIRVAADLPWRFYIAGSAGVSRRDRAAERRLSRC